MPAITIGAAAIGTIPGRKSANSNDGKPRTALALCLMSGDGSWSWNTPVTATGATDAGVPLTVGIPIVLNGLEYSDPLYIYSAAGAVVNYVEYPAR